MKMVVDYHHNRIGAGHIELKLIFSSPSGNHGWIKSLERNCILSSCDFSMKAKHLLLFRKMTFNRFEIRYHSFWNKIIRAFLGTSVRINHYTCLFYNNFRYVWKMRTLHCLLYYNMACPPDSMVTLHHHHVFQLHHQPWMMHCLYQFIWRIGNLQKTTWRLHVNWCSKKSRKDGSTSIQEHWQKPKRNLVKNWQ